MDGRENRSGLSRVDGEDLGAYVRRLDEYIQRLVWQSEGHRMWYTHKNPYGCWICDIIFIIEQLRTSIIHQSESGSPEDISSPAGDLNNAKSD